MIGSSGNWADIRFSALRDMQRAAAHQPGRPNRRWGPLEPRDVGRNRSAQRAELDGPIRVRAFPESRAAATAT